MDNNLLKASTLVLRGIDNGWDTAKMQRMIYKEVPVFKSAEDPRFMYGVLIYDMQVVLIRVEERYSNNVVEIVFNIEK